MRHLQPLGVGINLQPNAVRELFELGISETDLDKVGVPAAEWALVGLNGAEIYSEPRGRMAGYRWPQYAVHRGEFHMMLYDKVVERIAPYVDLGFSELVFHFPGDDQARAIEHFARDVLPRLRARFG